MWAQKSSLAQAILTPNYCSSLKHYTTSKSVTFFIISARHTPSPKAVGVGQAEDCETVHLSVFVRFSKSYEQMLFQ